MLTINPNTLNGNLQILYGSIMIIDPDLKLNLN